MFLSDDSRETINLGIANRKLVNDDNLLIGTNFFYDHELDYNHRRASIGLEAISSVGSFTYNEYFRLSSWKSGVDNIQEKALNGRDMEIGSPLPFLPSTNLYYRTFEWEGASGAADQEGDDFSLEARFKRFNVEIGKRSFDGVTEDEEFVKVTYRCCKNNNEEFVNKLGALKNNYNISYKLRKNSKKLLKNFSQEKINRSYLKIIKI